MTSDDRSPPADLIRVSEDAAGSGPVPAHARPWPVLIVDDESEVHRATSFALAGLTVSGRHLEFLNAYSAAEARAILDANRDVAVVLLDVVMETEEAGLHLVHTIRGELGMSAIRIVLRTGQPGYAPEMQVMQEYDINDYRTKAELTRVRLATTITTAIRSFEQIRTIEANRRGLDRIVKASTELFARRGMESFCDAVLAEVSGLLELPADGLICARSGGHAIRESADDILVVGASGRYRRLSGQPLASQAGGRTADAVARTLGAGRNLYGADFATLHFRDRSEREVVVFLDTGRPLADLEIRLLEVFSAIIWVGLENVGLFERLHAFAYCDPLSGLPNRLRFVNLVDEQISRARKGWVLGIVDVDHFSETNDALGHESGDRLLRAIATRLREALPEQVVLARVAGDAFGVFGPEADVGLERVLGLFESPFHVDGYGLQVSASLGLARLAESTGTGLDALKNANIGLKRAKSRQRGRFHFYTPEMEVETRERVKLANDLRICIEQQKLKLYYQPQISLVTGRPTGAEALLRWQTPDGNFVPPDRFIPIAEYSGMIHALGEWVMRTACHQLRLWNDRGLADFRMAVNVSLAQFRKPGFPELAASVVRQFGIDPRFLEFEITESMAMEDVDIVIETLARLKESGASVAIDDFGTGFSSLGYLHRLRVDRLKIDRTFVNELSAPSGRASIAEMIVRLGHNLGLSVIAEGVEAEEQADRLKVLGCDEAQGYYYARPVDLESFESWLEARGLLQTRKVAIL